MTLGMTIVRGKAGCGPRRELRVDGGGGGGEIRGRGQSPAVRMQPLWGEESRTRTHVPSSAGDGEARAVGAVPAAHGQNYARNGAQSNAANGPGAELGVSKKRGPLACPLSTLMRHTPLVTQKSDQNVGTRWHQCQL